jgi:type IV secretion system protein VirD4
MLTPVRSHFSMRELKTAPGGVTIYLCLPPSMLSICRGWLRLFVNMTLSEIERATVGDDGDIGRTQTGLPVLLCLDEFASLGYMRQLEAASAYVAGYGALLWVVLQDLSQLQRHYRSSWETFIGNAGMLQFFGTMDLTTQKYVSERLGTTRVALRSRDYTPGGERNQSPAPRKSLSFAEHPVLTPAEVGRLTRRSDPLRRQIVFVQEQPAPLLLQRVDYYRSGSGDIFAGRFDGPGGTEYGG